MTVAEQRQFRKLLINMILATDMTFHFKLKARGTLDTGMLLVAVLVLLSGWLIEPGPGMMHVCRHRTNSTGW